MGWRRLVGWWILGILVHGSFLAGTAIILFSLQNALAALLLAIVYLALLAVGTRYMYGCEQAKFETAATTVNGGDLQAETTTDSTSNPDAVSTDETPASEALATDPAARAAPPSDSSSQKKRILLPSQVPLYLSLWVALLNGWVTIPGLVAIFTLFPCGDEVGYMEQYVWRTNTTLFSSDVLEWMQHPHWRTPESFVRLADGTIYLAGSYDGSPEGLWSIYEGEVTNLQYTNVHKVTVLDENEVCFVQTVDEEIADQRYGSYYGAESNPYAAWRIGCGNRTEGFRLAKPRRPKTYRQTLMFNLHAIGGLLWFRQITDQYHYYDDQERYCDFWGIMQGSPGKDRYLYCPWDSFGVYSFDPFTLEVTSYSQAVKIVPDPKLVKQDDYTVGATDDIVFEEEGEENDGGWDADVYEDSNENNTSEGEVDNEDDEDYYNENDESLAAVDVEYQEPKESIFCQRGTMSGLRATIGLLLSALPSVATSARSWIKYGIPSSSVSLFLAIGLSFSFAWAFISFDLFAGLGIWVGFGTPVWTLISAYQVVVNPRISKEPHWWSLRVILTGVLGFVAFQAYREPYVFEEIGFGIFSSGKSAYLCLLWMELFQLSSIFLCSFHTSPNLDHCNFDTFAVFLRAGMARFCSRLYCILLG